MSELEDIWHQQVMIDQSTLDALQEEINYWKIRAIAAEQKLADMDNQ